MSAREASGSVSAAAYRGRGVRRAVNTYLVALLLLAALSWLIHPELGLLDHGTDRLIALAGAAAAALLAWLFPVVPAGATEPSSSTIWKRSPSTFPISGSLTSCRALGRPQFGQNNAVSTYENLQPAQVISAI